MMTMRSVMRPTMQAVPLSRRETALAIGGLTIAVAADRLSVSAGGTNFRVELLAGGLLALWLLVRGGFSLRGRLALAEYGLLGWWAANVVSSVFFSPFRTESVKQT